MVCFQKDALLQKRRSDLIIVDQLVFANGLDGVSFVLSGKVSEVDAPKSTFTKNCLEIKVTKSYVFGVCRFANEGRCAFEICHSLGQAVSSSRSGLALLESGRIANGRHLLSECSELLIWHIVIGVSSLGLLSKFLK